MSETENNIYDLNKLEDMFEAIDSLTRATAVLANTDRQLAGELVKLTNTLINLSESGQTIGGNPEVPYEQDESMVEATSEDGIEDLTLSPSKGRAAKTNILDDDDDYIIDVLTGEKIKK